MGIYVTTVIVYGYWLSEEGRRELYKPELFAVELDVKMLRTRNDETFSAETEFTSFMLGDWKPAATRTFSREEIAEDIANVSDMDLVEDAFLAKEAALKVTRTEEPRWHAVRYVGCSL